MTAGILLLPLLVAVCPFLSGMCIFPLVPERRRGIVNIYLTGLLLQFALFQCIAVPFMLMVVYPPFYYVRIIFSVCLFVLSAAGIIRIVRFALSSGAKSLPEYFHLKKIEKPDALTLVFWCAFFILCAVQLYFAYTRASFDGDDAYYIAQSLITEQTDVMYRFLPYTGHTSGLDTRHALASITMWEAYIARATGIHATKLAHSVLPFFFIPLSYLVFANAGRELFSGKERGGSRGLPLFLFIISLFNIYGNTSIYTAETFFLTRTWQGKAVFASAAVPLYFMLFLMLFNDRTASSGKEDKSLWHWLFLFLLNTFSGMCTSIGILFGVALTALFCILLSVYDKNPRNVLYGAICCVPSFLMFMIYVILP